MEAVEKTRNPVSFWSSDKNVKKKDLKYLHIPQEEMLLFYSDLLNLL